MVSSSEEVEAFTEKPTQYSYQTRTFSFSTSQQTSKQTRAVTTTTTATTRNKFSTSSYKNPIYEIDYRSEKLNDLMLMAYQSANFKNDYLLDKILKQFLTNITKMKIDDLASTSVSSSREYTTQDFRKTFPTQQSSSKFYTYQTFPTASPRIDCAKLEDGDFVRDPNDCSSFYTCFMGKANKRTTCDYGLVFDNFLKVCNWKSQVAC